ncbi:MAG: hypothetical protein JXQ30_08900 [Spirochaetes bacterium]|nr:hypothetical protein [Spirochaetota bacterium]
MKKALTAAILGVFLLVSAQLSLGQEKRIYNDGVIDYVPLTANFVLEAWDKDSSLKKIEFSVDGSPLREYTTPLTFGSEGRHVIVYRAIDDTGNISGERIYSVIVDGSPPEGLVSVDGPVFYKEGDYFLTKESNVVIWAEDDLSGVDTIWVSIDGGEYRVYQGKVTIENEGHHTASSYAVDNVGNRSSAYSVSGYVDNTPPAVKILSRDPFVFVSGKNYTNRKNEFRVIATDKISGTGGVWVSLDNSEWFAYSGPFRVQIPGFHSLRAKARDMLMNESDTAEVTFFVDTAPPEATLGTSVEDR